MQLSLSALRCSSVTGRRNFALPCRLPNLTPFGQAELPFSSSSPTEETAAQVMSHVYNIHDRALVAGCEDVLQLVSGRLAKQFANVSRRFLTSTSQAPSSAGKSSRCRISGTDMRASLSPPAAEHQQAYTISSKLSDVGFGSLQDRNGRCALPERRQHGAVTGCER